MKPVASFAVFVSSHGYGHAARACAIMAAMQERFPELRFEIFTRSPAWFFAESLRGAFGWYETVSDVGLVQQGPLSEDLPATLRSLVGFIPFNPAQVSSLSCQVNSLGCQGVICDISPLGLEVARKAGLPGILVENFTWDWIYEYYLDKEPGFRPFIEQMDSIYKAADYHIQTAPVCRRVDNAALLTAPVSRKAYSGRAEMRSRLGIPTDARMVLVTMGGIPEKFEFLEKSVSLRNITLVIPGGSERVERRENLVLLPRHSNFYHPDLVNASDAVVGKAGYSTLAETYHAGVPFASIPRPGFRETAVLVDFIKNEIGGFEISAADFQSGKWVECLEELLSLERIQRSVENGAQQAAEFILKRVGCEL